MRSSGPKPRSADHRRNSTTTLTVKLTKGIPTFFRLLVMTSTLPSATAARCSADAFSSRRLLTSASNLRLDSPDSCAGKAQRGGRRTQLSGGDIFDAVEPRRRVQVRLLASRRSRCQLVLSKPNQVEPSLADPTKSGTMRVEQAQPSNRLLQSSRSRSRSSPRRAELK